MTKSFLDLIKAKHGDGNYAGDEHGGARGGDGSGLPTAAPGNFMFATGIECSNPTIGNGRVRRDLLEECGHYDRWREDLRLPRGDLRLTRGLGIRVLRYGLPIHRVYLGPGKYDWDFADLVMARMKRLGITPILDLLHFGVPDWIGDFQNPELPLHFASYCDAVAERYPWVRYYTPVNEIYVTARSSAKDGVWNEQLKSDKAFVTAMKHLVAASILGTQAIAARRPDCIVVQSESAEYTHEAKASPSREIALVNKQRLISLDLLYAHHPDGEICQYLMDGGLTREEYDWFMAGAALRPSPRRRNLPVPDGRRPDARGIRLVHGRGAAGLSDHGQRLLRAQRADHPPRRRAVSGAGRTRLVPDHPRILPALQEAGDVH